ncbi:Dph6-related ATP pyrophosphatase [Paenibacillus albus]|uniref:Diphthine--ammonia ligase n=1 Tax=Paenibacillus albus TaxID=2495582 RepID=A0A3S8ZZC4_9BACL|nr:diphthine--ammonia ligase [Paenibacillus albus]AZN38812.1 diphthine--ammonia ligase [Paenibacillus albus]
MKFAMMYSGGKDSSLALYRMINEGHTPVALVTTFNEEQGRSWFHGITEDLLTSVSESLDIPLIVCRSNPETYSAAVEEALKQTVQLGAEGCAFGDIDIEGHKEWNEQRCNNAGLSCVLPLWQEDRRALTEELIHAGFKAAIKIVQSDILDESFLGQTLTTDLVERITAAGSDPCGENGEYHTFVYDGPLFRKPIPIEFGRTVDFKTHMAIDIRPEQHRSTHP